MNQLKLREEELKLRVREFEINEEHKSLQRRLKEVQSIDDSSPSASDSQV